MSFRRFASLLALLVACSQPSASSHGRVVVAITIDWEGAYISPEGLDALDDLRKAFPDVPLTHFMSAAYYTKATPEPNLTRTLAQALRPGDELAVHLHAWQSLARASGIEPRLSPSFLTGTDNVMAFEDGDSGFDVDVDAYSIGELRAMVRTSRRLLEATGHAITPDFRAGGYLGTPKMLEAIRDEGYAVDSSAVDFRQLATQAGYLSSRLHEVWPDVDTLRASSLLGGDVLELPIAATADYLTPEQLIAVVDAATERLRRAPGDDVLVVLAFHQETAHEFSSRITDGIHHLRAANVPIVFTTIERAADATRAR